MSTLDSQRLVELRREFHQHPEPAWREFYTTHRLVEEIEKIGIDTLAVGPEAYDPDDRMAVPDVNETEQWREQAQEQGADPQLLEKMAGGNTGAIAVLDRGEGPSIGLRVDIDGLFIEESTERHHTPTLEGFRSQNTDAMHACGHDAHMTWGLAVLQRVKTSDFSGRFTVFFQPAEEVSGGGNPMAKSRFTDGIDNLFAVHIGLDHPTGEVISGIERPLAMCHVNAAFNGTSAHAGKEPNEGDNAVQALGTAIQNAYAIPRHGNGMTRVNIGTVEAGTASNIIAERAVVKAEARGGTTRLMEYTRDELRRVFESAAEMHDCELTFSIVSESPRADSDSTLIELVTEVASGFSDVEQVIPTTDFGASEDATFLMKQVQEQGGYATYLIIGTDHPSSHHTPGFDIDERSLHIGAKVLTESVLQTAEVNDEF